MIRARGLSWGLVLVVALSWLSVEAAPRAAHAETPLSGRSICLDAGHGGSDPGAVHGGIEEQAINLDVALYLEAAFSADGADVTMTRISEEQTLSSRDRYSTCNDAGSDILISIHTNAASNADLDGTMTIYFHEDDRVLAGFLQTSMYGSLSANAPVTPFVDFGLKKDALGVLLKSGMPAATVESVLMSNAAEIELLQIDMEHCGGTCRRGQIAEAIRTGVLQYFANVDAAPPGGDGGGTGGGACKPAWHPKCAG
jgi:N-acetylmuramoyl-L-alanine amidase